VVAERTRASSSEDTLGTDRPRRSNAGRTSQAAPMSRWSRARRRAGAAGSLRPSANPRMGPICRAPSDPQAELSMEARSGWFPNGVKDSEHPPAQRPRPPHPPAQPHSASAAAATAAANAARSACSGVRLTGRLAAMAAAVADGRNKAIHVIRHVIGCKYICNIICNNFCNT
jgi:hypothetical protein